MIRLYEEWRNCSVSSGVFQVSRYDTYLADTFHLLLGNDLFVNSLQSVLIHSADVKRIAIRQGFEPLNSGMSLVCEQSLFSEWEFSHLVFLYAIEEKRKLLDSGSHVIPQSGDPIM